MVKVKALIEFLNSIEDKEQYVVAMSSDFSQGGEIEDIIEIKKSSDKTAYPVAVCLICDF